MYRKNLSLAKYHLFLFSASDILYTGDSPWSAKPKIQRDVLKVQDIIPFFLNHTVGPEWYSSQSVYGPPARLIISSLFIVLKLNSWSILISIIPEFPMPRL